MIYEQIATGDMRLNDGDMILVGRLRLQVIHAPATRATALQFRIGATIASSSRAPSGEHAAEAWR